MKRLSILFAIVTVLFASCNDEVGITSVNLSTDRDSIYVVPEGGTEYLQVTSTMEWTAVSNKPWISISPANGIGSTKCSILIDSTLANGLREAKLTFETVEGRHPVIVEQGGYGKFISLEDSAKTIASSTNSVTDRYFEVKVSTNVNFKISITDSVDAPIEWITPKQTEMKFNFDRPSRPRSTMVRFDWNINTEFAGRSAYIHFLPLDAADTLSSPAVLAITQEAAPTITDDRKGDSLAIVAIVNRLQLLSPWDMSENMKYWNNVTLWESTDKEILSGEVPRAAIGRVRKASFMMCYTKESIPQELRYLKYIETLNIYSNVNTMLLNIELGNEICELEFLKHLQIGAFGLVSLPDELKNLKKLETLDLNSNNFTEIPSVLTKENFPNLKSLNLLACRRWTLSNLSQLESQLTAIKNRLPKGYEDVDGIGLHFNTKENEAFRRLLLWDTLEELRLSNNYIEGELPSFMTIENGDTVLEVDGWTKEDITIKGVVNDTLRNLVKELADSGKYRKLPKILPNMKRLTLNLNFFTGKLPDWLLFHPHLLDWFPESLIYMQQVNAYDSEGKVVKFDNEPSDYGYYYDFFPGYDKKYEIKEEIED